jgi:hypothetical protein
MSALPLQFLPLSNWLMAVLCIQMFSPTVHTQSKECRIIMTLKILEYLVSQTKFCGIPGPSSLKTHKIHINRNLTRV